MRIGIVSVQDEWMFRNYGSLFQCYALQQILKRAGHTPFLIRRRLDNFEWTPSLFIKRLMWVLLHPISYLKGKIWTKQQATYADITAKSFQDFFYEHITSTPQQYGEKELMEFPPDADCYICGSDQVWTSSIPSAFLLFAEGNKRIAYAASCNWLLADKEWKSLAHRALAQFHAISVREKAGCEICRSLLEKSGQAVSLAIDPVLLLEPDAWHHLAQKEESPLPPPPKYLLLQAMGISSPADICWDAILQYARQNQLEIKVIATQGAQDNLPQEHFIHPSPCEFLEIYRNAACVITNSFHGAIFSLIYHKPFLAIRQEGPKQGQEPRFHTLLEKIGALNRLFYPQQGQAKLNWELLKTQPNSSLYEKLESWKEESLQYLFQSLETRQKDTQKCSSLH